MTSDNREWARSRDALVNAITSLGYPVEFGKEIAKNLGSPKAMYRMTVYLREVQPDTPELIGDEMIAIMEEIAAWRQKKEAEEANARYNDMVYHGLRDPESRGGGKR